MAKKDDPEKFYRGLEELGLSLSEGQIEQFLSYYETLIEWNRNRNLTAITDWDDVVTKHFLDSLCLVKAVPELSGQRMIDVGTGAGFPGIPLKIAFPDLDVVLVDSVNKKTDFVNAVIGKLGLSGAVTVHGRAEDLGRMAEYRQQFDLCVARAVSELAVLSEYCLPFVRIGGRFIAYKGAGVDAECEAAEGAVFLLGGEMEPVQTYSLPGTGDARTLVCVKKKEGTPRAYPRKAGMPAKNPLK